jgi:succinoglycan biosynthesis protein ExoM
MSVADVDICICTFRRPYLATTLRSVAALDLPPVKKIRVVGADNDDTPSARGSVEAVVAETGLPVTYIHAPARNISVARNACLDAATAPFLAFIDDDELATPGWLTALLAVMEGGDAAAVLGPVHAIYGPECPGWIRAGDFHSTLPALSDGKIATGCSTGNVLLRRDSPAVQGLRFREEFGKSGGEDTLYFSAIYKAGGRIVLAPAALVTEIVPPGRANFTWLIKRRFRSGQTHGVVLLESNTAGLPGYLRRITLAAAKAAFCFGAALLNVFRPGRMRFWVLRGGLHAGVVGGRGGQRAIEH